MNVVIVGAAGRMGQALLRCAAAAGMNVVAAVEDKSCPLLGKPVNVAGLSSDLVYTTEWPSDADAVIDFSFHACVPSHLETAVKYRQGFVLGTTGLDAAELEAVNRAAQEIPVVRSANMSTGVNLLLELVRRSASILGADYDIEITEIHHRLKKDAPSGTALMLAEEAAAGRKTPLADVACYGREGIVGERPCGEIGIHAIRGGSVVGDHTVMFMADEERIEITHKAHSRDAFAKGALRAGEWLVGRKPGLYSMRNVLGFENEQ